MGAMRILLLAVTFALAGSATAHACSCVPASGDPAAEIAAADAAVYGKVVKRVVDGQTLHYTLRVTSDYKGNLGRFARFTTAKYSAACGVDVLKGRRVALLLYRQGNGYTGNLCGVRSRKYFEGDAKASSACQALA
jgi:hypothetical protein